MNKLDFCEYAILTQDNQETTIKIGRFEEHDEQIFTLQNGIMYFFYFDVNRKEIIKSKREITESHNDLMKIFYLKFPYGLVEDYRNKREWI